MTSITALVDSYLEQMKQEPVLMRMPDPHMPKEMIDSAIPTQNDWIGWKPIDSTISDSDIDNLEQAIGYNLPQSFRAFLKHKHFYNLSLPDFAVNLPRHLPEKSLLLLRELVFDSFDPDFLIKKGYIYFADFHDYGLLCFDANQKILNNEYQVVYIDHENLEDVHIYASSFVDLLTGDAERGNRFIEYLNELYI